MLNKSRYNRRELLREDQLDARFEKCPFCFSRDTDKIGRIQEEPEINAAECNRCKIGFVDRQPAEHYLIEYYRNYYKSSKRYTTAESSILSKHIIKQIGELSSSENYSILDFGGGDGSIAQIIGQYLIKKDLAGKINIINVDYYPSAPGIDSGRITLEHFNSLDQLRLEHKFDLIIASAILEHVKNPASISLKLLNSLKSGGKCYFRTPYIYPFFKIFRFIRMSIDIQFPGHLFDMGNLFWSSFLKNQNLSKDFHLIKSQTSLVETLLKEDPVKATISYLLKLPSRNLKNHYHLVGGWEVIIEKIG